MLIIATRYLIILRSTPQSKVCTLRPPSLELNPSYNHPEPGSNYWEVTSTNAPRLPYTTDTKFLCQKPDRRLSQSFTFCPTEYLLGERVRKSRLKENRSRAMAPVSASSINIALHISSVYYDEPSASTLCRPCTCDPYYHRHIVTMALTPYPCPITNTIPCPRGTSFSRARQ